MSGDTMAITTADAVAGGAPGPVDVVCLGARGGPQVLTYSVPAELAATAIPGVTVVVPLGTRQVSGVVVGHATSPPQTALRPLVRVLDAPPLPAELLATALWAARYYRAPLPIVLAQVVAPAARTARPRRVIPLTPREPATAALASDLFGDETRTLSERIQDRLPAGGIEERTLLREFGPEARRVLRDLAARGAIRLDWGADPRAGVDRNIILHARAATLGRAPLQARIHQFVLEREPSGVGRGELTRRFPGAAAALARLIEQNALFAEQISADTPAMAATTGPVLHDEQVVAIEAIHQSLGAFQSFLLHGVTGSGKTEVYLHTAALALERGLGVLLLVPEIGLTPQLAEQAGRRFPGQVAILHSGLTATERAEAWRGIATGALPVVIGARSALFAPIPRLGLIVVVEDHDAAYKQGEAPRYHGRDLALVRAREAGCPIVLGSATPSLESWSAACAGRFRLLRLTTRANAVPLPAVEILDLRAERVSRHDPQADQLIAAALRDALIETYRAGEQSVLFLNRRGWALLLHCDACGHVERCKECSVSLTLHRARRAAICHHCGFARARPQSCSACGVDLAARGSGTEQLEAIVASLLPAARVARLDRDVGAQAGHTTRVLRAWRAGELDVLVGTQMVTKGHDAPGVTLIGVVLADASLHFPDFRANERTFQLLAQVAGRAGRGERPGRVIIQTRHPDHPSLIAARSHDFEGFAAAELRTREELGYPPYSRLARILLEGPATEVDTHAQDAAMALRTAAAAVSTDRGGTLSVLGPAPAPLERLRGRDRRQILVKASDHRNLAAMLDRARLAANGQTRLVVDIDPLSML